MIADSVVLGETSSFHQPELVNLYGCRIGDGTRIGAFVEIQRDAASAALQDLRATRSSAKA